MTNLIASTIVDQINRDIMIGVDTHRDTNVLACNWPNCLAQFDQTAWSTFKPKFEVGCGLIHPELGKQAERAPIRHLIRPI